MEGACLALEQFVKGDGLLVVALHVIVHLGNLRGLQHHQLEVLVVGGVSGGGGTAGGGHSVEEFVVAPQRHLAQVSTDGVVRLRVLVAVAVAPRVRRLGGCWRGGGCVGGGGRLTRVANDVLAEVVTAPLAGERVEGV